MASIPISMLSQSLFCDPMALPATTITTISTHDEPTRMIYAILFARWISSSPRNSTIRSRSRCPTLILLNTGWRALAEGSAGADERLTYAGHYQIVQS